jgi:hypothetical protein
VHLCPLSGLPEWDGTVRPNARANYGAGNDAPDDCGRSTHRSGGHDFDASNRNGRHAFFDVARYRGASTTLAVLVLAEHTE